MKRASLALGLLALVAFLGPVFGAQKSAAVAATPTPAALQYDQIARMVIPPATAPPPGQFQPDFEAIVGAPNASGAAATPTPAPHHGIGSLLNQLAGNGGSSDSSNPYAGMLDKMRKGTLTRYTYYKGWIRTDDVVAQTAVISKCAEHQYITLNLAAKTYTMTTTEPACNTHPQMPMGPQRQETENLAPGTADLTITASQTGLGPLTLETIPTSGYDNTMQMSTTNATGSCSNGDIGMNVLQYVSKIAMPRQYCPVHAASASDNPTQYVVRGGCKPTMHESGTGSGAMAMDKLVMYSKMTFNGGTGGESRMSGFAMVTERGNVKWLSGAPADALFTIPPGFTQAN